MFIPSALLKTMIRIGKEAQNMGDIYGNAYLVISAPLAKNGDEGLYQERSPHSIKATTRLVRW